MVESSRKLRQLSEWCLSLTGLCLVVGLCSTMLRPVLGQGDAPASLPTVRVGEILIQGTVTNIDTEKRTLSLLASSVTLPGKDPVKLTPARLKVVRIDGGTEIKSMAGGSAALNLADIKVGEICVVVGPDRGVGTELLARTLLAGQNAAPADGSRPAGVPKTVDVQNIVAVDRELPTDGSAGTYGYGLNMKQPAGVLVFATGNYAPRWIPPHRKAVVVAAATDFSTVDVDGRKTHIGQDMYFDRVSPDGKTIYATKAQVGLFAMNFDGTGLHRIGKSPIGGSLGITPDGQHLIVQLGWSYDDEMKMWIGSGNLAVISADGSELHPLPAESAHFFKVAWMPDGRRIVGVLLDKVLILGMDGSILDSIPTVEEPNRSFAKLSPHAKWVIDPGGTQTLIRLADRKRFLLGPFEVFPWSEFEDRAICWPYKEPYRASLLNLNDPENPIPLDTAESLWEQQSPGPSFSPDGRFIAYVDSQTRRLGIVDVQHPENRKLTQVTVDKPPPDNYEPLTWTESNTILVNQPSPLPHQYGKQVIDLKGL